MKKKKDKKYNNYPLEAKEINLLVTQSADENIRQKEIEFIMAIEKIEEEIIRLQGQYKTFQEIHNDLVNDDQINQQHYYRTIYTRYYKVVEELKNYINGGIVTLIKYYHKEEMNLYKYPVNDSDKEKKDKSIEFIKVKSRVCSQFYNTYQNLRLHIEAKYPDKLEIIEQSKKICDSKLHKLLRWKTSPLLLESHLIKLMQNSIIAANENDVDALLSMKKPIMILADDQEEIMIYAKSIFEYWRNITAWKNKVRNKNQVLVKIFYIPQKNGKRMKEVTAAKKISEIDAIYLEKISNILNG